MSRYGGYESYSRGGSSGYSYADERESRNHDDYPQSSRGGEPSRHSYAENSHRRERRAPSPSSERYSRSDQFESRYTEPSPARDAYGRSQHSSDLLYPSIERSPSPSLAYRRYDTPDDDAQAYGSRQYRGRTSSPSPSFHGEGDEFDIPRRPIGSDWRTNRPEPRRAPFGARPSHFDVYEDTANEERYRQRSAAPPPRDSSHSRIFRERRDRYGPNENDRGNSYERTQSPEYQPRYHREFSRDPGESFHDW